MWMSTLALSHRWSAFSIVFLQETREKLLFEAQVVTTLTWMFSFFSFHYVLMLIELVFLRSPSIGVTLNTWVTLTKFKQLWIEPKIFGLNPSLTPDTFDLDLTLTCDALAALPGCCREPDQAAWGVHHHDGCQWREDQQRAAVRWPPHWWQPLCWRQDQAESRQYPGEVSSNQG